MTIIYIHGFNSSPASLKARQTKDWLEKSSLDRSFLCPALDGDTFIAIDQLQAIIDQCREPVGLIGSSLGGYYATWLAKKYGLKAVLVNPAVRPYESMSEYLGENTNYHSGERYMLNQSHIDMLRDLDTKEICVPDSIWVLLQTGDEVLDYRQAKMKYSHCILTIEPGGDHSFQNYTRHLPAIIDFLQP
ncbi:MAG: YqiA/YcfP family alpha/beta fold hydrolase [Porticoccus sp.]